MGGHAAEELVIEPLLPSLCRSRLRSERGRVPKGCGESPVPPRADRDTDTGPTGLDAAALKGWSHTKLKPSPTHHLPAHTTGDTGQKAIGSSRVSTSYILSVHTQETVSCPA